MAKSSTPQHARLHKDDSSFSAQDFEQDNVHSVYESIASHFSNTRYKPWPLIPAFLNSLPAGSIGADLGCGNGKYLSLRSLVMGDIEQQGITGGNNVLTVGLDRSANLIDLARHNVVIGERVNAATSEEEKERINEVSVGDALQSSFRNGCFDFALSIATIHHFSTPARRKQAVQEIIRIVKPIQQIEKPAMTEVGDERIVLHAGEKKDEAPYSSILRSSTGRFLIYVWALEQRGESRRQFESISKDQSDFNEQGCDLLVPWVLKASQQEKSNGSDLEKVFQRYYHVFEKGELEALVEEAGAEMAGVRIELETSGWEKGNWYGIWQCVEVR